MGDVRQAFRFVAPVLAEAGYRVARMDQRGHGESTSGWSGYGSPATGEDMLALVRHLGGPAAIIGHSSSAAAAVWAAAEEPVLVSALVLIGPFARQRELPTLVRLAFAAVTSRAAIWSRVYYPTMYKAPKPADFAAYVRALQANLREGGRMAATRGAMGRQVECYSRVAEVGCPVRIVMGTRDPDFPDPAADSEYARAAVRGPRRDDRGDDRRGRALPARRASRGHRVGGPAVPGRRGPCLGQACPPGPWSTRRSVWSTSRDGPP